MPITQLDPIRALISIDLQNGIVAVPTAHPAADVVARTAQLARAFRDRGFPVVLVNVAGAPAGRTERGARKFTLPPDWTDLVPELDQQPGDVLITKRAVGAFIGTSLDEYLRGRGVTQVFFTGISTSRGVESTARDAYDLGYNVVLVVDAMTDRDADSHRHSVEKIFPALGEPATTDDVLRVLREPPVS